jgi:hypothetical protein
MIGHFGIPFNLKRVARVQFPFKGRKIIKFWLKNPFTNPNYRQEQKQCKIIAIAVDRKGSERT